jgi:hypothetical protein
MPAPKKQEKTATSKVFVGVVKPFGFTKGPSME